MLQDVQWERLVVDEAHKLNNRANGFLHLAVTSALTPDERNERAKLGGRELDCKARWCVTGTPVTNKLEDWGAQLAVIGATAAQQAAMLAAAGGSTRADEDSVREALVTGETLHGLALRRTKLGVKAAAGTELPRCFVRAHWSVLPPAERQKYVEELSKTEKLGKFVRGRMLTNVQAEPKKEKDEGKAARPSGRDWARNKEGRLVSTD